MASPARTHRHPSRKPPRVVVVGGGMAGMFAALASRARDALVTLVDPAPRLGGKIQQRKAAGRLIDAGPTVVTMPWVFRRGFAEAGLNWDDFVTLEPLDPVARHAWRDGTRLDLFANPARSEAAIAEAFGRREATAYRAFVAACRALYERVEGPFILAPRPTARTAWSRNSLRVLAQVARIDAHLSMRTRLRQTFRDPRLVQLFGRMSTYAGGAPGATPATLNLIAHVETEGVFRVQGGVQALADGIGRALAAVGVTVLAGRTARAIRRRAGRPYAVDLGNGDELPCDIAIVNAPAAAVDQLVGSGPPPPDATRAPPCLSADTYCMVAACAGVPLVHHNIFFACDPDAEFDAIFNHRQRPAAPTVYICAQDGPASERSLLCLVNAPSTCQEPPPCPSELGRLLAERGLTLNPQGPVVAHGPNDFRRQFAHQNGALYGDPPHGWRAFFRRPGSLTPQAGVLQCGGHAHPGPGLPMTALSGMQAAAAWAEA